MAVRKICVFPDPVLREKTEPVADFEASSFQEILVDMWDSMVAHDGVGLAAPQIGLSLRLAVVELEGMRYVLANPQVLQTRGEQTGEEGCLSFPGIFEKVTRPGWVKVKAQNEKGEPYEIQVEGFLAKAFLHEIDHLNGVLLVDHLSSIKRSIIKRKLKKREEKA